MEYKNDQKEAKAADEYLMREAWLNVVKPVEMAGRLDHVKARPPMNKREEKTAQLQNYFLTRKSQGFNYQEGQYERIFSRGKKE